MGNRPSITLKYLFYIYMEEICKEIKDDMKKIEEDSKKIDCYAILDLIMHCLKCIVDSFKFCKILYNN